MASELYVETLKGLTSGANANKVIIPSGQTLDASAGGFTTPEGHVIQVVQGTRVADNTFSTGSYTSTGLNLEITPSSATSKVFVTFSIVVDAQSNANQVNLAIFRDSTNLTLHPGSTRERGTTIYSQSSRLITPVSYSILDEPNTTSSITYDIRIYSNSGSSVKAPGQDSGGYIQAMEIAG